MRQIFLLQLSLLFSALTFSQTKEELYDSLLYYYQAGEFHKGIVIAEKTVTLVRRDSGDHHPDYASSISNLARLYRQVGQYDRAEQLFLQVREIRKKVIGELHKDYATTLTSMGDLYEDLGQYEKAEQFFLEAREIRKKLFGEHHIDYANSLNNLALLYIRMNKYEYAEPLYQRVREICRKTIGEDRSEYATCLNNLANVYHDLGQYEKAEQLYLQAIEINKKVSGENHINYGIDLNNLSDLYQDMALYDKAEPLSLRASEIFKLTLGEDHPYYAKVLSNQADIYRSKGRLELAESLFERVKDIFKAALGEGHPDYATGLNNLAMIYQNSGQYARAEPLFLQTLAIRKKVLGEDHSDYAGSLHNLATLYQNMGLYEKAGPLYTRAKEIRTKSMFTAFNNLSEKEKGNYLAKNISLNDVQNSFIFNYPEAGAHFIKENYNLQLLLKSLILRDTKNVMESVDESKDSLTQMLFTEWKKIKKELSKQYALPLAERRKNIIELEDHAEEAEKELVRRSAGFRDQLNNIGINSESVRKQLQDNEVAIEFVKFRLYNKKWTDSIIYAAYILHKSDSVPHFIPLCEEKQLQRLLGEKKKTDATSIALFYGNSKQGTGAADLPGDSLYKLIWQPLEPFLKGVDRIAYSPVGQLYGIAMHAIRSDSKILLMDRYELTQYTSTRQVALRKSDEKSAQPSDILLFGNADFGMDSLQIVRQRPKEQNQEVSTTIYTPEIRGSGIAGWPALDGTAAEINRINSLFTQYKKTARVFSKMEASEANLKAQSGHSPQILHLATHGFFLPGLDKKSTGTERAKGNVYRLANDPLLRTGLVLAGGNFVWSGKKPIEGAEDGILTAYEVSQLNLRKTELVVLSACETGLGDIKGSEGVFGLQRGFKMAGVKKMIVSLWKVPDKETAELMTVFYSHWLKGKTLNDAFSIAQAEMRNKYSPFYWAAFVLVE